MVASSYAVCMVCAQCEVPITQVHRLELLWIEDATTELTQAIALVEEANALILKVCNVTSYKQE
jgi:hypothetical protein